MWERAEHKLPILHPRQAKTLLRAARLRANVQPQGFPNSDSHVHPIHNPPNFLRQPISPSVQSRLFITKPFFLYCPDSEPHGRKVQIPSRSEPEGTVRAVRLRLSGASENGAGAEDLVFCGGKRNDVGCGVG